MISSTEGVVIHTLKYGDTSVIARIFTRNLGMQSYLVRGVRQSRSSRKQYLFQPLTIVQMVVSHKEKASLHYIKEIQLLDAYQTIPCQVNKTSLAIFLAEVLSYALKNQEANEGLFLFLRTALLHLDNTRDAVTNFHLVFLVRLSKYLGFHPANNHGKHHRFFHLREGVYQASPGASQDTMDEEESQAFMTITGSSLENQHQLHIPKALRKSLLQKTIYYYRHHLAGMPEVKSLSVLETIFSD